ncbi:MAG: pirin, partial [Thermoanaerobaculia bacterium]
LSKPTLVPWESLRSQFGSAYSRLKDFKRYFLTSLVAVLAVYPKARVRQHAQGLLLQPSPYHISPRPANRHSTL